MTEITTLKNLLKGAALSAKRKAKRKKLPIAISENGEVLLVYPNKKVKIVHKLSERKKAN